MDCLFGIDIGGTAIKIGKFINDKLVLKTSIETNKEQNGKFILEDIFKKIDEIVGIDNIVGIGVGVPGPVSHGVVLGAQNLGWGNVEVSKIVQDRYPNCDVKVLNDANAAAVGEMAAGGAKIYKSLVFMTLGTGIGGGIIIDGDLIEGNTGSTGEIGHIRVGFNNERKCTCGLYDCVEQYSSATGIVITANLLRKSRKTILNEVEVTSKNIFDYAKLGDEVCLEVVDEMIEKLATAIAAIANTVNPQVFVIGGGVSKAGQFLIDKIEKRFKEICFYSVRNTRFVLAELGNDAGIYGTSYSVKVHMNAH